MSARFFAIVPAAGRGERMAGIRPKQYLQVAGRTLLEHAVAALACDARIEIIFVVVAADDVEFAKLDWSRFAGRVAPLYCGGASRRESVANGLAAAGDVIDYDDWVLVHDAARPGLDAESLARLIDTCKSDPVGGLLAIPVTDTLKRAKDDATVERTEPRDALWQAQTPQMFPCGLLIRALDAARRARDADAITDEASAVERLGLAPRLVRGSLRNLKVTWPEDVALAECFLGENR